MIYMSGDNNLSLDMVYALQKIRDIANKNKSELNLLVYYDGYSPAIPTLYCDFSEFDPSVKLNDQKLYFRSYAVENKLYKVEEEFDEDSALKYSVVNFINWCVHTQKRQAENYGFIFSGHSFGFQSIGMLKDESSNHTMSMEDIDWILDRITNSQTGLDDESRVNQTLTLIKAKKLEIKAVEDTIKTLTENSEENAIDLSKKEAEKKELEQELDFLENSNKEILGKKLGILGFDSCVMSMLEVGNQFKNYAETMIASEGSVPNAGWSYAEILKDLKIKTAENVSKVMDAKELAETFVRNFIEEQDRYTIGGSSVDLAAWDLSKLDGLNTSFAELCDKILDCFKTENTLYRQMKRIILNVRKDCQSYMFEQNVDLGDFCELLKAEVESLKTDLKKLNDTSLNGNLDSVSQACDSVLTALKVCIILGGFSGGRYQYSNGISLFFPWSSSAYSVSEKDYEKLSFVQNQETGQKWKDFLIKFVGEISYRKSIIKQTQKKDRIHYSYQYDTTNTTDASNDSDKKIPDNPASKMPNNVASKMPDNAASKLMGGGANRYLEYFMKFDNIEIPWNISGYTKDQTGGTIKTAVLATEPIKHQIMPQLMQIYPAENKQNDGSSSS